MSAIFITFLCVSYNSWFERVTGYISTEWPDRLFYYITLSIKLEKKLPWYQYVLSKSWLHSKYRGNFTVPLKSIDVQVSINGLIANVKSDLHYVNDKDENIETVFVFPLDSDAAVYKFEAEMGGRTIVAEVQEKSQVLYGI